MGISRRAVPPELYRSAKTTGGRRELSYPVAAWLGRAAARALSVLPYRALYALGGVLPRLSRRFDTRPAFHTAVNLRLCFPSMDPAAREALARASLAESGRAIVELAALWHWPRERLFALVRGVDGEEHVDRALALGRGVLLLGPHLGAWEMSGLYCSSRFAFTALYTAPFEPALDRFFARARTRFGGRLAPATIAGTRTLLRALAAGEAVGIMPDQDPGRGGGVFVPFFGVKAATTTLVARLARATGAPAVIGWAERLLGGAGYRLHFRPGSPAIADPDLVVAATALNESIERLVRECPEQYLWSYKRFRIQPEGRRSPYAAGEHPASSGYRAAGSE